MDFKNYGIESKNGKTEKLKDLKHGIRREQLNAKFRNIFDAFDTNKDGTLEANELESIHKTFGLFAGEDKVLNNAENTALGSVFSSQFKIENADFMGFVKSVSDAGEDIISSEESVSEDGGKVITTTYKNGLKETLYYYPDGEYKMKEAELHTKKEYTKYIYEGKEYSEEELDTIIKNKYKKEMDTTFSALNSYEYFKQNFIKSYTIPNTYTDEIHQYDSDLSDRAKNDVEVRNFVISHFVDTHNECKAFLDEMGAFSDTGAVITTGAGEAWNLIKNKWNGSEEEYKNFYELLQKFDPDLCSNKIKDTLSLANPLLMVVNAISDDIITDKTGSYSRALQAANKLEEMQNNNVNYFKDFNEALGIQYSDEKGEKFQQSAYRFQVAQGLSTKIKLLNDAIDDLKQASVPNITPMTTGMDNTESAMLNSMNNPAAKLMDAKAKLAEFFDDDKEMAEAFINDIETGAFGNFKTEGLIGIVNELKQTTETNLKNILGEHTLEEAKADYIEQYKDLYQTDFVPEELTEKVGGAIETGAMVRLGALTAISCLLTRSPILGTAIESVGSSALARVLVSKFGQQVANRIIQEAVKIVSTGATIGIDAGLNAVEQMSSEAGISGEKMLDGTLGAAKYIGFSAYIGGPLAQAVSKMISRTGSATQLFAGATKNIVNSAETRAVSGEKFIENMMQGGSRWNKVLAKAGAFATDAGAFTALEVATEGTDLMETLGEQGEFLGKLKIMNHAIEYMLGGKVHAGINKAKMDLAIEQCGIKNWNITEIKDEKGTRYSVECMGIPVGEFNDINIIATAMIERISKTYETAATLPPAEEVKDKAEIEKPEPVTEEPAQNASSWGKEVTSPSEDYWQTPDKGVYNTNDQKINLRTLCADANRNFSPDEIIDIEYHTNESNIDLITKLSTDLERNLSAKEIRDIAACTNEVNIDLVTKLCTDSELNFPVEKIADIAACTNKFNIDLVTRLCTDSKLDFFFDCEIADIAIFTNEVNIDLITKLCTDPESKFNAIDIKDIATHTNKVNIDLITELCTNSELDLCTIINIKDIATRTNKENIDFVTKLCTDSELNFPIAQIVDIAIHTNKENTDLITRLCTDSKLNFPVNKIAQIAFCTNKENIDLVSKLCTDSKLKFSPDEIREIASCTKEKNIGLVTELCTNSERNLPVEDITNIVTYTNSENTDLIIKLCTDSKLNFPVNKIANIAAHTNKENIDLITELCTNSELKIHASNIGEIAAHTNKENIDLITKLCTNSELKFSASDIIDIAACTNNVNIDLVTKLCTDSERKFFAYEIRDFISMTNKLNIDLATELSTNSKYDFSALEIKVILCWTNNSNIDIVTKLCTDSENNLSANEIRDIALNTYSNKNNIPVVEKLLSGAIPCRKENISFILQLSSDMKGNIAPEFIAEKVQKFMDCGFDKNLIEEIFTNSSSLSFYNDEILAFLKAKIDAGEDITTFLNTLNGNIPSSLPDKINMLIQLNNLTPEETTLLKKQGIDIDAKIQRLSNSIDKKHETITTSKDNCSTFLKAAANNRTAEKTIRDIDFEQVGKDGITLQYSREEFMRTMDNLISQYSSNDKNTANFDGVQIPELKLSEQDKISTKNKIAELRQNYSTEEVEVIIDGQKVKGTRFLGTQGGSNTAYYTQIGDKLYYIKYPEAKNLGQSVEEVMASELYRAAGIDSPNQKFVYDNDGNIIGMASEYVPNLSMSNTKGAELHESFATDAWLANWDAPKNDNTQFRPDGSTIKVDVGGSLNYRARGELKADFGNIVNELTTLLENNSCYANMTKTDLLKSLKHVTKIDDNLIQKIVDNSPSNDVNIANILIKRQKFLQIFAKNVESLDESQYNNILDLISEAKIRTITEFENEVDIAGMLGYVRTKTGFEGLLNTRNLDNIEMTPEQRVIAEKMRSEIEHFTTGNRVADNVNLSPEAKDFINAILKGIPEFAPCFGKNQHATQKYSLDIHILKVLQDSMNDPLYNQLSNSDKLVLKFSTLLHDIGKRYLADGSDTGHAEKSAEYVYSILDRFKLSSEIKDRIITNIANHHWFKEYNTGKMSSKEIATLCRRPEDFLIYQIMAKADLKNVNDNFYKTVLGATSEAEADAKFAQKIAEIEPEVQHLAEKQIVITASQFADIPERVTQSGRILEARTFPTKSVNLNGVETELKVLNLTEIDENTDMFQYGFNHIPMKDLRFTIHSTDSKTNFDIFKTLSNNPMNNSAQSISMISMSDKSTYCNIPYGLIVELDNANISHAYYSNTSSGTKKGFEHFVEEMFETSKYRTFVKDEFKSYMSEQGIELTDSEYATIAKYLLTKKYPETQIKSLKIGDKIISREDLLGAFTYSRDQLIEIKKQKTHGSHNEIVALNSKVKGVVAKVSSLEECPSWLLEFANEHNLPIILIGD